MSEPVATTPPVVYAIVMVQGHESVLVVAVSTIGEVVGQCAAVTEDEGLAYTVYSDEAKERLAAIYPQGHTVEVIRGWANAPTWLREANEWFYSDDAV